MRTLIIVFMLVCGAVWGCDYCIENPGEKELMSTGIDANNGTEQLQRGQLILLRRINEVDKKVKHVEDTLDKIYPMVAEIKGKTSKHPCGLPDYDNSVGHYEGHAWNGKPCYDDGRYK